jgi:FHA domain
LSTELEPFVPALKIRIGQCDATFDLEAEPVGIDGAGRRPTVVTVTTPRVIVGRGPDAALPILGAAASDVSRVHLIVEAFGGLWTVADPRSTNGTEVEVSKAAGKSSWRRLAGSKLPIESGMTLLLASSAKLYFEPVDRPGLLQGPTTDRKSDRSGVHVGWIEDRELEEAAEVLLRHHRLGHPELGAATVADLMEGLHVSRRTVYRRLDGLRGLRQLEPLLHRTPDNLADALMHVYPYLLAPREGDTPRGGGDETVTSAGG